MDIQRTIRQLKNDKKRIEKNIDLNKKRFIEEIKSGLGAEIKKSSQFSCFFFQFTHK